MANPTLTFVLDPKTLSKCSGCGGTDLTRGEVTWTRGRDKATCPRAQCRGCGQEFLPISAFTYWNWFVRGEGTKPTG